MTNDPTSLPTPDDGLNISPEISVGPENAAQIDGQDNGQSSKNRVGGKPSIKRPSKPAVEVPSRFEKQKSKSQEADAQLVDQTKTQILSLIHI